MATGLALWNTPRCILYIAQRVLKINFYRFAQYFPDVSLISNQQFGNRFTIKILREGEGAQASLARPLDTPLIQESSIPDHIVLNNFPD